MEAQKDVIKTEENKKSLFSYYEKYMLVVGILGQAFFYAQGIKIFLEEQAVGVSLPAFLIAFITVTSWMVYGLLLGNRVLVISNAIAALGALFVVIGILIHG